MAQKRPEEKKKQKKKGGHGGLIILIIIFLLLALLFLLNGKFGWFGDGDGDGSGDGDTSTAVNKTVESLSDENAADKNVLSITVKGSDYVIDGKTMTLEEVKTELGNYDKDAVTVEITDDGAVEGAFKGLTDTLDELGFKHAD